MGTQKLATFLLLVDVAHGWMRLEDGTVNPFCRKEHLPQTEFARYDCALDDPLLVEGETCEVTCLDVKYQLTTPHTVKCTCLTTWEPDGQTSKLCIWLFENTIDADVMSVCGYDLYSFAYTQDQTNRDTIQTGADAAVTALTTKLELAGTYVNDTILTYEPAFMTIYNASYDEVQTRLQMDNETNANITAKINDTNVYLLDKYNEANETILLCLEDLYGGILNLTLEILNSTDEPLRTFIDAQIDQVVAENENRLEKWKNDLIEYAEIQAAIVQLGLNQIIADARTAGTNAIDSKINQNEPGLAQTIRNIGDTCLQEQRSQVALKISEMKTALEPSIETKKAATEVILAAKVQAMEDDLCDQIDVLTAEQEAAQQQAEEDLMVTLVGSLEALIATTQTDYRAWIDTNSSLNMAEITEYVETKNTNVSDLVLGKLETTQQEIEAENAIAREEALVIAQMYADDIQTVLEHKLEHKLEDERNRIRDQIDTCDEDLNRKFDDIDFIVNTTVLAAEDSYNETRTVELDLLNDAVLSANGTHQTELTRLHDNFCDKIHSNGNHTAEYILKLKITLTDKIQKIVDTVRFEMQHNKDQITYLQANHFY